jgi:GH24 family phage-related lysozyme (muramidase)
VAVSKFKKLQRSLQRKGYSEKSAGAIAYTIGVKKYGKAGMARKAAAGRRRKACSRS